MRYLLPFLFLIGLSACQNLKHKQTKLKWSAMHSWSVTGKMSINDGLQSGSGKFDWIKSDSHFEAQFKAPLGQGSWKITENNKEARLSSSKHADRFADNAQELISNELGWSFPLENLNYWLRGFHYLDEPYKHKNNIDNIQESGWNISYQKWQSTPMGLLPTKIKASKPPYSVKLIIYHWNFD